MLTEMIEAIRAAVADGATPEQRAIGAQACRTIHAALGAEPGKPIVLPGAPQSHPLAGITADQALALLIARLTAIAEAKEAATANTAPPRPQVAPQIAFVSPPPTPKRAAGPAPVRRREGESCASSRSMIALSAAGSFVLAILLHRRTASAASVRSPAPGYDPATAHGSAAMTSSAAPLPAVPAAELPRTPSSPALRLDFGRPVPVGVRAVMGSGWASLRGAGSTRRLIARSTSASRSARRSWPSIRAS